jgi:hypothetical protein
MFTEFLSGVKRFFTTQRIIVLVVFLLLGWGLMNYSGTKDLLHFDGMEDGSTPAPKAGDVASSASGAIGGNSGNLGENAALYQPSSISDPSSLLPLDVNGSWSTLNPSLSPNNVYLPDMLDPTSRIGLNSIGGVMRNSNLSILKEPVIPKQNVSPWNNSDIPENWGRQGYEIGSSC